jgi:hypothetical protein
MMVGRQTAMANLQLLHRGRWEVTFDNSDLSHARAQCICTNEPAHDRREHHKNFRRRLGNHGLPEHRDRRRQPRDARRRYRFGSQNGAIVARVAAKLAPNNTKLFLSTTHFHPEHAAGEPGFPPGTILIRNAVQPQEMEKHGQEMITQFAKFPCKIKTYSVSLCCGHPT